MKKLRSKILKFCVIGLICSGLGLAAAQPAEANKSSRDFANWLQSVVKNTHSSELEHKLAPLKNSANSLYQLIEQASQIVSENNEDFNLPLDAGSPSKNIHQILLIEWNQFQTGNSMAAVPPAPSVKSFISFQSPKSFTSGVQAFNGPREVDVFFMPGAKPDLSFYTAHQFTIAPMSGGIAIGAP